MSTDSCTPPINSQERRGWQEHSGAIPTEKIEGCASLQPLNKAPAGSLNNLKTYDCLFVKCSTENYWHSSGHCGPSLNRFDSDLHHDTNGSCVRCTLLRGNKNNVLFGSFLAGSGCCGVIEQWEPKIKTQPHQFNWFADLPCWKLGSRACLNVAVGAHVVGYAPDPV